MKPRLHFVFHAFKTPPNFSPPVIKIQAAALNTVVWAGEYDEQMLLVA